MRNVLLFSASFGCLVVACALPDAQAPAAQAPSAPAAPVATTTAAVVPVPEGPPVAKCEPSAEGGEGCFPDERYRGWLCDESAPGTAVPLFGKGTPWVRAYVTRDLESWDPTRPHAQKTHLGLDEEVIVLRANKPKGDVMVVGATNAQGWASVDAVRADGQCVSLMADEITTKRPMAPKHAPLAWEKVDDRTRSAWLALPDVKKRVDAMAKACVGAGQGCAKAKSRVVDAVVAHEVVGSAP